jgi:GGDEF domain-containing protein
MRDFHLMDRSGTLKPFFPKIIPDMQEDGKICFQLLLQPRISHTAAKQLRAAMVAQLDESYPTPQAQWLAEIAAWQHVEDDVRVPATIGLLAIDQEQQIIEWHGEKALSALWQHIADEMRQKLREYDSVLQLGAGRLGVMLLDSSPEVARLVLNRLRWQLTANPTELPRVGQISYSFSASYMALEKGESPENLWKRAHTQLALSLRAGDNHLVAA